VGVVGLPHYDAKISIDINYNWDFCKPDVICKYQLITSSVRACGQ